MEQEQDDDELMNEIDELIAQNLRLPRGERADLLIINDLHAVQIYFKNPGEFPGPSSMDGCQYKNLTIKVVADVDKVSLARSRYMLCSEVQ